MDKDSRLEDLSQADRLDVYCMAVLRAEHGLTQDAAGRKLGIPGQRAFALEAVARSNGVLVHLFNRDKMPADPASRAILEKQIDCRLFPLANIKEELIPQSFTEVLKMVGSQRVRTVQVFPSVSHGQTPSEWADRIAALGRCAGPPIARELQKAKLLGVSWGTTVWKVIENVIVQPEWVTRKSGVTCVPMQGDMVGVINDGGPAVSPSTLARRMAAAVKGNHSSSLSLSGVPAFIPRRFVGSELTTIKELIHGYESYNKVFDAPNGHWNNLDAIITSVGAVGQTHQFWSTELNAGGASPDALKKDIVGDIGGVLLQRPDQKGEATGPRRKKARSRPASSKQPAADEMSYDDVVEHMTGIRKSQFERCAQDASKPGVIVVALGKSKGEVMYESIRLGLINHLFIDEELAKALWTIVESKQ